MCCSFYLGLIRSCSNPDSLIWWRVCDFCVIIDLRWETSASKPPESLFRAFPTDSLMSNPSYKGFVVLCGLFFACTGSHFSLVGRTNTANLWWDGLEDWLSGSRRHPQNKPSNLRHLWQVCFSTSTFPQLKEALSGIAGKSTEHFSFYGGEPNSIRKTTSDGSCWSEVKMSAGLHSLWSGIPISVTLLWSNIPRNAKQHMKKVIDGGVS